MVHSPVSCLSIFSPALKHREELRRMVSKSPVRTLPSGVGLACKLLRNTLSCQRFLDCFPAAPVLPAQFCKSPLLCCRNKKSWQYLFQWLRNGKPRLAVRIRTQKSIFLGSYSFVSLQQCSLTGVSFLPVGFSCCMCTIIYISLNFCSFLRVSVKHKGCIIILRETCN